MFSWLCPEGSLCAGDSCSEVCTDCLGCERHLSAALLTLMANAYPRRESRRGDLRLN